VLCVSCLCGVVSTEATILYWANKAYRADRAYYPNW